MSGTSERKYRQRKYEDLQFFFLILINNNFTILCIIPTPCPVLWLIFTCPKSM